MSLHVVFDKKTYCTLLLTRTMLCGHNSAERSQGCCDFLLIFCIKWLSCAEQWERQGLGYLSDNTEVTVRSWSDEAAWPPKAIKEVTEVGMERGACKQQQQVSEQPLTSSFNRNNENVSFSWMSLFPVHRKSKPSGVRWIPDINELSNSPDEDLLVRTRFLNQSVVILGVG